MDAGCWQEARARALEELADFHDRETLQTGMSREALRALVSSAIPHEAWRELLASLASEGSLRLEGERVARAGHSVVLEGAERELAERIDDRFARQPAVDVGDGNQTDGRRDQHPNDQQQEAEDVEQNEHQAEREELLGPDWEYVSLVGDRDPPLDYRRKP